MIIFSSVLGKKSKEESYGEDMELTYEQAKQILDENEQLKAENEQLRKMCPGADGIQRMVRLADELKDVKAEREELLEWQKKDSEFYRAEVDQLKTEVGKLRDQLGVAKRVIRLHEESKDLMRHGR